MSDLRDTTKDIQRHVGVEPDGVFGPVTAARVLHFLTDAIADTDQEKLMPAAQAEQTQFDPRSEAVLATLDPKAVPFFRRFLALAQATAATLGCDYRLVGGNRSYAEQDALYEQGRGRPGPIVTNARGGQSNHNFGIAVDAGVFQAGVYLDDGTRSQQTLAEQVHKACATQATACGLDWGGSWQTIMDEPHFEVHTGLSLSEKRDLYNRKGSVL